jgi:hypothetical protein
MRKLALALAVAAACVLAVAARSDAAMVCCSSHDYFSGYVAPGQGGSSTYDDLCNTAITSSQSTSPGGYYATVALIDRSGGWRRSLRSNQRYIYVFVDPNNEAGAKAYSKKAHCKNSDNTFVYNIVCNLIRLDREPGTICV